jgi:quinoprotein glucose dehydrogenase
MRVFARNAIVAFCVLFIFSSSLAQQYRLDTLAQSPSVALPTCMVFTPDGSGKFFFTEKNTGNVRIYDNGSVRATAFARLGLTGSGELGLLGIAVHPQYPDSPYVYVQYTRRGDRAHVVTRLRDSSSLGVDPRVIVVAPRVKDETNHNIGTCHFGPDGKLYVSFGESAPTSNAQDSTAKNPFGKILRLNPNGTTPFDNPFAGKPFWSIGHRNSNDFTWDALTGKMYCSENGRSCNDEINLVPPRGNMGWPVDGNCTYANNPAYVRPLYYFPSNLPAVAGIAVYRANAFPRLRGKLLVAANNTANVYAMTLTATGDTIVPNSFTTFFSYSTAFSDIEVGPDGNLYITSGPSYKLPGNSILRLRPVAPVFSSAPPTNATQGVLYSYTPAFDGTPPSVSIVSGPEGMVVDTTTWTIRWIPTNEHALQRKHNVVLRARNGAGSVDQIFTVIVANVNDPPGAFALTSPPNDTTFAFTNSPALFCTWTQSFDPDLDTVKYTVQLDTVSSFNSRARRDTSAGANLSLRILLPRFTREYYWRVKATDGQETVLSPHVRLFRISMLSAVQEPKSKEDENEKDAALKQNFPNPFNPTTTITYSIPYGGRVRLSVFNLLGQEVSLIFEGVQSTGTYEVQFDKNELPTGIYFYRIQAPGFVETRKMIITK